MPGGYPTPYIGVVPLLSFGFSVISAVLAIDMYRLLRTGQSGNAWRVLIIASVMFSLLQTLHFAELFNVAPPGSAQLSEIVELIFVISLAYAFHLQRRTFTDAARYRQSAERRSENDDSEGESHPPLWQEETRGEDEPEHLYSPIVHGLNDHDEIEWDDDSASGGRRN